MTGTINKIGKVRQGSCCIHGRVAQNCQRRGLGGTDRVWRCRLIASDTDNGRY